MNSRKLEDLLQKFQEGKTTAEENETLLKWYEKLPVNTTEDGRVFEENEVEDRIWAKLEANASQKTHRIGRYWRVAKIAASIVLLLGLSASIYSVWNTSSAIRKSSMVSFVNTTDVVRLVALEDGSKISLQPNSELKYPQHFSESSREVFLSGEAFFEIAHDVNHPFIVHARDIKATVLGTSFNISAYDTDKEVSVKVRTGKVSVVKEISTAKSTPTNREIFLTPNQQVVYDVETKQVAVSLVENPVLITHVPLLEMKFIRTSVVEIFEAIETAYNVDIQFDPKKIANCRITTEFSDDDDLYERIRVLCHAFGAKYSIDNMVINIESDGCK